jgi:nucleoid DNA-binding protein
MDIAQYISDLLKEHEEVSLPGIGTFCKKRVAAYLNQEDGLYYPPSYKVDFKSEEGSHAVLVKHIISRKHISESSALYFLERFIEDIKNDLDKESNANVAPLGELLKTDKGYTLKYAAATESIDLFGLTPVKEYATLTPAPTPYTPVHEVSYDSPDEESSRSKTLWIVLVLVVASSLAVLAYFYYPQYFRTSNPAPKKPIPERKVLPPVIQPETLRDSIAFADSLMNNLEKEGIHGAQVEKAPDSVSITTNSSVADTIKAKPKPEKIFEVVIASFGLKSEAERSAKGFRRKGIDAKIVIDDHKPKYKISIGTFTSMSAANKEKKRIQEGANKDAWILTIDNKEN